MKSNVNNIEVNDAALFLSYNNPLMPCCISYRNLSFVLQNKANDWSLYQMQQWVKVG